LSSGEIVWRGERVDEAQVRSLRGGQIAAVFQDALATFNPTMRMGDQLAEGVRLHRGLDRRAAGSEVSSWLQKVGLTEPERVMRALPHELSGGMRQRAMIAMALAMRPALLIADEPTASLDASLQRAMFELMASEQRERQMAVLLVTHDLVAVAEHSDELAVMYAGRIVERGPAMELLERPRHPYTAALIRALPRPNETFRPLPGQAPGAGFFREGCRFRDRCDRKIEACATVDPVLGPDSGVACHNPLDQA
jgi:peptide/nickel transport system ATP-binding protein